MNVLLIVVGIILLLSVIICYKRGLVKILASLLATLVCIVLVFLISPSVSKWIQESTPLRETVKNKCIELLLPDETTGDEVLQTELPREEQISMIEGADIPDVIQKMLLENNNSEAYDLLEVTGFHQYVGAYIANMIIHAMAYLISFVIVWTALKALTIALDLVTKLPLLHGINRLAGGVLGRVLGIVLAWVLFLLGTVLCNGEMGQRFVELIYENQFLTLLYNYNFIMTIVFGLIF